MIRFLMEAGPFIWPIILLTLVIGFLVLWNVIFLLVRPRPTSSRRQSINAVLFWGGVAAMLGLLGQWMGIHNLTQAIAEMVNEHLSTKGVAVVVSAEHSCMAIRGVRKPGSITITSALRGEFKSNQSTRSEFMSLIKGDS